MTTTTNNTNALVNEVLAKSEVEALLKDTLAYNHDTNNYLSILKGTYTTWDGEVHDGYIVSHNIKTATPETANDFMPTYENHINYYFMEVTLEEVENPFKTSHLWNPTFHKLMPITENHKYVPKFYEGNAKALCDYIIAKACRDNWEYTQVPMSEKELKEAREKDWLWYRNHTTKVVPLTYNDINSYWSTSLTEEEKKQKAKEDKMHEEELIARFSTGELPIADDNAWYSVLSSGYGTEGYDLECKIIKILKNRGYSVRIDGERDSFGWVTRGIFVNNEMMCLI